MRIAILPILLAIAVTAAPAVALAGPAKSTAQRKPDLADAVAGTYEGAVVADVRGPSGEQVVVTVTRVAKNMIEVSCDCTRMPTVRIALIRTVDAIMNGSGHNDFLVQKGKDPRRLDASIDGLTMILRKS